MIHKVYQKRSRTEKLDGSKISKLTFYTVEIRYPEEYVEPCIDEARELYETAKEVKQFVMKRLKEKGL